MLTDKPQPIMYQPFFVLHKRMLKKLDPMQVALLETEGNYTKIYLTDNKYYHVRSSLSGAIEKLPPDMFLQVQRSLAVSIFYIDDIARDHLTMFGKSYPVGKRYYSDVISRLNIID